MTQSIRQLKALVPAPLRPTVSAALNFARRECDRWVYERPNSGFRRRVAARATLKDFATIVGKLLSDGVVIIPDHFSAGRLAELREEFERLVASNPPGHGEETNAVHVPTGRIAESLVFSALAFEQDFIDVAEYYWGKNVVLTATGGTRLNPYDAAEDYGSYQWHHDGKRKQLRVMIILTDVLPGGQHMDYVAGSHRKFRHDIGDSRVAPEVALNAGACVSCTGPAGSIVFFDTNGYHRGNRNLGPKRDHWQFTYRAPGGMALEHRPPLPLHPDVAGRLTAEQRRIARLP